MDVPGADSGVPLIEPSDHGWCAHSGADARYAGQWSVSVAVRKLGMQTHVNRARGGVDAAIPVLMVSALAFVDLSITNFLFSGRRPWLTKSTPSLIGLVFNFLALPFVVF
jgi:hypothetical protein